VGAAGGGGGNGLSNLFTTMFIWPKVDLKQKNGDKINEKVV